MKEQTSQETDVMKGGIVRTMDKKRSLPMYVDRTFLGVPQSVAAAYENKWAGNITAYPLDADPVADDPVYRKLDNMKVEPNYWDDRWTSRVKPIRQKAGKVAWGLLETMKARRLNERQYMHIAKTPTWKLKLEFALSSWLGDRFGRPPAEKIMMDQRHAFYTLRAERTHAFQRGLKSTEYNEPNYWDLDDEEE